MNGLGIGLSEIGYQEAGPEKIRTKEDREQAAKRLGASLTREAVVHTVAVMAKTLYIIDGHAHIYAAYYAPMRGQLTSPSGEPTQATYIFTTAILGLIQRCDPDMLVVALDSKAPTFRRKIYPEYKAHRPPMPDDLPAQIDRIEQILDAMNIPMLRVDGFEADDIIGTLAKKASADGHECFICSNDKDILQLIDENVSALNIKKDIRTDLEALKETMGVTPNQFLEALALQGDTSDNIPGLPDVGPKTALTWIQEYGSIENLYKHADEIKGKRGESLRNNPDTVKLSKELVTIDCNVPIDIDYGKMALKEFDKPKLAEVFAELGFSRLLTQLGLNTSAEATAQALGSGPSQSPTGNGAAAGFTGPASAKTTNHDYRLIDTPKKFDAFFKELKKQKLFAIDTETTAILPMRADLVGLSFSWEPHKAYYLPVKAPLGAKHLDLEKIRPRLGPILADEKIRKVGQNIKYDLLVLQNAGLPVKGVHFDTMVASYCLDPGRSHGMNNMALDFLNYECIPIKDLIGKGKNQLTFDMVDTQAACEYAAEDADITFQLYLYLKARLEKEPDIHRLFEQVEMPLVSVLATMEHNGVSVNAKLLREMSGEIAEALNTVTDEIYEQAETVFNIDSPKQLGEILFDKLGLPPIRIGKSGRSTDAAVLDQLAAEHPIAEMVLHYRTLSKLRNTYVDKLGSLIHPRTKRVHASFNQTITATGRLSSSSPNLQNIPIRTELGRKIRSAFVPAKKTDCILSADYSQIELRLLAAFSKDKAMMEAFAEDQDIHRFVASQIYGVAIEEVTSEMRSQCKAVNFGIIYGQGAFGLSRSVGMSITEAKKFIDDYFARYSSIREFMDGAIEDAKKRGYAETILHRRRRIANLNSKNANKRSQAQRLAVNTVIQGSAADLTKIAMIDIQRKIEAEDLPVKLILQIHDELVFELPRNEAEEHARWIAEKMTCAIDLDVPLKVDISYGPTWLAENLSG
ncbi:MAG: DNA polymerase I [Phycisphaerae bacterium]|nr:DNA polymerase I [Phycisphaerae bacterium]